MKRSSALLGSLGVIVATSIVVAQAPPAQQPQAQTTSPPSSTQTKPERDPAAIQALERMGTFLRKQQTFSVKAKAETEMLLDNGQKVQFAGTGSLTARRPDHLHARITSDRKDREYFFDGKRFTLASPRTGYYATVAAPKTILEVSDLLKDRYALELPLVDLFLWGTERMPTDRITSAIDVGPSTIDGVETEHYAFREPNLDWQIWIEKGPRPLPRRLVLTSTDEENEPQHQLELSWNLAPKINEQMFTYTPPKNAHRIAIAERSAEQAPPPPRS